MSPEQVLIGLIWGATEQSRLLVADCGKRANAMETLA